MSDARQWQDLMPRVLSAIVMVAVGATVLWLGGWSFTLVACAVCGLMIWEAARMFGSSNPMLDGTMATATLLLASMLPGLFVLPILVASAFVSAGRAGQDKPLYLGLHVWVLLACFTLVLLREHAGLVWILWLVCVVVASDVAGYFAGRMLGGPKFWPAISPKKTWSGTIAGWVCAALVGLGFAGPTGLGLILVPASVLVGFAGQMGDIAESAAKRRTGVKDSSNLIPGHGGVLDRFDALMGAGVAVLFLWSFNLITRGV